MQEQIEEQVEAKKKRPFIGFYEKLLIAMFLLNFIVVLLAHKVHMAFAYIYIAGAVAAIGFATVRAYKNTEAGVAKKILYSFGALLWSLFLTMLAQTFAVNAAKAVLA
jgi:hypothetical protein